MKALGKNLAGKAGAAIGGMIDEAVTGAPKVVPPPPEVWCITLRRTPPIHELDQPPLGPCAKFCIQMVVVPPAFFLAFLGWIILSGIYCFSLCCFPLMGQGFLVMLAERSAQRKRVTSQEAREAKKAAEATFCCAKCLLSLMSFAAFRLIRPFNMFTSW